VKPVLRREKVGLFDDFNFQVRSAAEGRKPRAFSFLKFSQQATLEVNDGRGPFVRIIGAVVGCGKYSHLSFLDFAAMCVFHLVVGCDKHPTVLIAESDYFAIFDVLSLYTPFVYEPLWKSLNGKSCRSQADCD
jgi:hypothetical protein